MSFIGQHGVAHLRVAEQLAGVFENTADSPVIILARVGDDPRVYAKLHGVTIRNADLTLVQRLIGVARHVNTPIILLCDLFAAGNEPPPGVQWDTPTRQKAATVGIMAYILMVMRDPRVARELFVWPSMLRIGVIDEEGIITMLPGEAEKIIAFIKKQQEGA